MKRVAMTLPLLLLVVWGSAELGAWGGDGAERPPALPRAGDSTPVVARRVWSGTMSILPATLAPDGRHIVHTDWDTGDLVVLDLVSGETRAVTHKGTWRESDEYALGAAVSRDGGRIAYGWADSAFHTQLRVANWDGSETRVVYRTEGPLEYVEVLEWSPDGQWILAQLPGHGRARQLALVPARGGEVRILRTTQWPHVPTGRMSFSPDGRYVVYDRRQQDDSPERDVFVLEVDAGREVPLVEHPADDFVLGWAPDGAHILFASDRAGTAGAWLVTVAHGRPQGRPELVKPDMWRVWPIGFARSGAYYYAVDTGAQDVYVATVDLRTGRVLSPPAKVVNRFVGANYDPAWSADGRFLAYLSRRDLMRRAPSLVIRSMETEEERVLSPELSAFFWPRWSPNGRSVMVAGGRADRSGLWAIDVQTGGVTALLENGRGEWSQWPTWSQDGRTILFQRYGGPSGPRTGIFARDVATGQERVLDPGSHGNEFAVSPDGEDLAFVHWDQQHGSAIMTIPIAGGTPRELVRLEPGDDPWPIAWTQYGLVYGLRFYEAESQELVELRPPELWRIAEDGGAPVKLELELPRDQYSYLQVDVHPDGRRFAFTDGRTSEEIWVLENFLPPEAPRR